MLRWLIAPSGWINRLRLTGRLNLIVVGAGRLSDLCFTRLPVSRPEATASIALNATIVNGLGSTVVAVIGTGTTFDLVVSGLGDLT